MSISLTTCTRGQPTRRASRPSSLHLTPKVFKHFYAWWSLFEGSLSLPIRQGAYFPTRPLTPKFGRHLATLKYRLHIPQLFIMHGYIDDSRESKNTVILCIEI
jgi:hypothetical protein